MFWMKTIISNIYIYYKNNQNPTDRACRGFTIERRFFRNVSMHVFYLLRPALS